MPANTPQERFGHELHQFFDHVTSHSPDHVHAAVVVVANADPDGKTTRVNGEDALNMHICNFGGGNPEILASLLAMAIDTASEQVPGFKAAFGELLAKRRLAHIMKTVAEKVKDFQETVAEKPGLDAAKPEADALLARLKDGDTKH